LFNCDNDQGIFDTIKDLHLCGASGGGRIDLENRVVRVVDQEANGTAVAIRNVRRGLFSWK
jgi:hypothetical protein